jgi:hypothetical protein
MFTLQIYALGERQDGCPSARRSDAKAAQRVAKSISGYGRRLKRQGVAVIDDRGIEGQQIHVLTAQLRAKYSFTLRV